MEKRQLRRGTYKDTIFGQTEMGDLMLSSNHQAYVWCLPQHRVPSPPPNWDNWPTHQVLVRRIIGGFPLDES